MKKIVFTLVFTLALICSKVGFTYAQHEGHEGHETMNHDEHEGHEMMNHDEHEGHDMAATTTEESDEDIAKQVSVTEHLGEYLPLEQLNFTNSKGEAVNLKKLITKPTLLLLVFYSCPMSCNIMLGELADVVSKIDMKLGQDYQIVSVSFDDEETIENAVERKKNFLNILDDSYPREHWQFLFGSKSMIDLITQKVGFNFKKMGPHNYVHPNILVALSPDGKITRYLYGPGFPPFDVTMSIVEAQNGTPGVSAKRLLSFCFNYDPSGRKYVVNYLRIGGTFILAFLGLFIFFLVRKKK